MKSTRRNWKRPYWSALSSVLGNISAGWFGVAFITPNFVNVFTPAGFLALTQDILFGIVFLLATIAVEREIYE